MAKVINNEGLEQKSPRVAENDQVKSDFGFVFWAKGNK